MADAAAQSSNKENDEVGARQEKAGEHKGQEWDRRR